MFFVVTVFWVVVVVVLVVVLVGLKVLRKALVSQVAGVVSNVLKVR